MMRQRPKITTVATMFKETKTKTPKGICSKVGHCSRLCRWPPSHPDPKPTLPSPTRPLSAAPGVTKGTEALDQKWIDAFKSPQHATPICQVSKNVLYIQWTSYLFDKLHVSRKMPHPTLQSKLRTTFSLASVSHAATCTILRTRFHCHV